MLTEFEIGAIVALKRINNTPYTELTSEFDVSDSTLRSAFQRVQRAGHGDSLQELLAAASQHETETESHLRRAPKVPPGSTLSAKLRRDIMICGHERVNVAVSDILHEAGITLCEKTILRVAREHRGAEHPYAIVRGVQTKKPKLDEEDKYNRLDYADFLIAEFNLYFPRLIFVCYDETSKAIGGKNIRGGKRKISRPRGQNPNEIPVYKEPPAFSLMICAATSTDTTINYPQPCLVWAQDTDDDHEKTLRQVAKSNRKAREKVDAKRARAGQPGTAEYKALQELNQNILDSNKRARPSNKLQGLKGASLRRGIKHTMSPQQFFKYEEFVYKSGKGMGGIWYAENVLKKEVFPYYCAIRERHPGSRVFLVQDNVKLHKIGLRYCQSEIKELGIKFAPHPPNWPDLHPIEHCFGRLEGFLADYEVQGASKKDKKQAEEYIRQIWQEDESMRQYMADRLHPTYFKEVVRKVHKAEGGNNFTA
ncbi:uncharacterized protein K441DRAFT_675452 [Cenococcum geophilum 1.58]|uniref:uncharacterized protein n=1 Tax=Cenococcum geophilum 1.58 TaxID=794803 RepID=UPI00358E4C7B|nr:hypothetical protein K441DRAFT_675452 [Cenococcum geophilum 1.58]